MMENISDKDRRIKTINDIINNYVNMEKSIVEQLNFNVEHGTTIGGFREEIWKKLFQSIVPKKFSIERSVFIIDSKGNVSNEVDLAIFDEQYTPYIFKYGTLKFIPIEAVAVVIECKSKTIKIDMWTDSIDKLRTSFNSVARMATNIVTNNEKKIKNDNKRLNLITQSSTRPIKILCCVKEENISEKTQKRFDFILQAESKEEIKLKVICNNEDSKLSEWHEDLNHYKSKINNKWEEPTQDIELNQYKNEKSSILTLIFQLNQLLMLINNPLLFPHMSYVKLFKDPEKVIKEANEK